MELISDSLPVGGLWDSEVFAADHQLHPPSIRSYGGCSRTLLFVGFLYDFIKRFASNPDGLGK